MPDLQDAISLLEKGKAREASDLLEAMAIEMPGYATARVLLARAYEGLGEWNGALESWREALQIVPNSPVILRGLERAAGKAASRAPIEELPELPSMSVSAPSPGAVNVSDDVAESASFPADAPTPEAAMPDPFAAGEEADDDVLEAGAAPPEAPEVQPSETERSQAQPSETAPPGDEDLDRLIAELESARIVPRPDLEGLPEPTLEDDIEDVVSVTLARIYASQGQYDEAARVYDLLAGQQPENEREFRAKADEMRSKASEE